MAAKVQNMYDPELSPRKNIPKLPPGAKVVPPPPPPAAAPTQAAPPGIGPQPPPPTTPPNAPAGPTDPFAHDPYGDIAAYENYQFDYPLQMMQAKRMMTQSFDPQRSRALQNAYAGVESGNLGAMSSIAGTSGLSAADRQAIMAQGQRQKVSMGQGSQAAIDQIQAQNLYDTQNYNVSQAQQAQDFNAKALNQRAMDQAKFQEQKALNLYQRRLQEALLQRQLEKSAEIAAGQK